jgi:glycosyltransferase involved in cell wall biosynthesis
MTNRSPRVSIGLPVYNGNGYLEAALDSLLNQTFSDFELIISDNASTDRTEEICKTYAAKDRRIHYYRNERNLGAAWNFNHVFALSSGEYFKWASHDDLCAQDFLLRCINVLDKDYSVVLCYTQEKDIDDKGRFLRKRPYRLNTNLVKSHERFQNIIALNRGSPPIFGVIRAGILRKTPLIARYYASDQVLLAELILHGRFHEIPEELLLHREHQRRSVYAYTRHSTIGWLDPTLAGQMTLPSWRLFIEYIRAIGRSPVSWPERVHCAWHMAKWMVGHRNAMISDAIIATSQILRSPGRRHQAICPSAGSDGRSAASSLQRPARPRNGM